MADDDSLSGGAIVGIVIGVILVIALILFIYHNRNKKTDDRRGELYQLREDVGDVKTLRENTTMIERAIQNIKIQLSIYIQTYVRFQEQLPIAEKEVFILAKKLGLDTTRIDEMYNTSSNPTMINENAAAAAPVLVAGGDIPDYLKTSPITDPTLPITMKSPSKKKQKSVKKKK